MEKLLARFLLTLRDSCPAVRALTAPCYVHK